MNVIDKHVCKNRRKTRVLYLIVESKNHPLGFWIHPADSTGQGQPGVSQGHLEVPWECQIGPKLKIYVKIIYCEHFLFFENFWLLVVFGTLFSEKCQFLGNFEKNLFLPPS